MHTTTDYDKQATDFLEKYKIRFSAKPGTNAAPPWAEPGKAHGKQWRIRLSGQTPMEKSLQVGLRAVTFPFWNSIAAGSEEPSAYDVLACISGDVNCPDTFKDFCSEYGYDEDSRKAEQTFKRCRALAVKLQEFFTEQEQTDLQEIQ